jgi:ATP-dependent Clp protease ATP-binding subunit ClpC
MTDELSTVLVDFLSRGSTFAIAATTPQGYTAAIERSILGRVFEKVRVDEPGVDEAIHVLESKILGIEFEHPVSFTYMAIEAIVQLSDRFMHESYLPKKAIEVAKEVAVMVFKERGTDALITKEDVGRLISEKTGVPSSHVGEEEKDTLLHLEERMHGRVVGQEEAVTAVAAALRRARTQLRSENRPIAAFLFLGPTGVGKTELAKTVAESYFGSENSMIRLDMSEYQQPESLSRLIGRPGTSEGGLLSEAVRQQPFALVLLDEFEKANPGILNVFLQVFDDGRLTDSAGRTIDFTNTILIATSNAGTQYIQDAVKQNVPDDQIKTHVLEEELKGVYRPELLNRFDGIIVFKPLTQDELMEITKRMIARVVERLETKGIHFRASDDVIEDLAHKGYNPIFGARPLRRLVQEEVDNAIANALLKDDVKRRDTIVLELGGIRIEKAVSL